MNMPNHPTHAVRHISNWDGEHDVLTSLCVLNEETGIFHYLDSGKPVLEYAGDEIINAWALTDQMAEIIRNARRYMALRDAGVAVDDDNCEAIWISGDDLDAAADRLLEGRE